MKNSIFTGIHIILGLIRVCGWRVATMWTWTLVSKLPRYVKTRDLCFVDEALGEGPFLCNSGVGVAFVGGPGAISAVRSIWIDKEYLSGGFLTISPRSIVVDLGATIGDFTLLALTHGEEVKVVSVEQSSESCDHLKSNLTLNGWTDRVQIYHGFIGGKTKKQATLSSGNEKGAVYISEDQFIENFNLSRINFLKCDIEGSEFALFQEKSRLLKMTDQLAIELHDWGGDIEEFKTMLRRLGFEVKTQKPYVSDCSVVYARRKKESGMRP